MRVIYRLDALRSLGRSVTFAWCETGEKGLTQPDLEIDAVGLLCPLPVLRLRKRLQRLNSGQIARLVADDPAAVIDVPHFCGEAGHELITTERSGDAIAFLVRKG